MPGYDMVVHGGTVVTSGAVFKADVAVSAGVVAAVAPSIAADAQQRIDATGRLVLPGFVDPHVHMSLPIGSGMVSSDDFESGTVAAACGGTTTIIDFTTQARGVSLHDAAAARRAEADGKVAIDYGLHLTVTDAGERTLREIERLAAKGYPSIKLYMTYGTLRVDDAAMLRILAAAGRCGALPLVHAENDAIVSHLTRRLLEAGRVSPASHPLARPPRAEGEAVCRALALARAADSPLYVVHVSCAEGLAPLVRARAEGQKVYGETCPHYLLLSEEEYERSGFEGARYVMTPPLRPRRNWQLLWDALRDGLLDVVATDHCPWLFETQKVRGKGRFDRIPGGVGGVETRASLLYSEGPAKRRLTLERFVDVLATNPARIFGLYPQKGVIAPGSDADLVIFDPSAPGAIRQADLHQHVDYTVFEGWPLVGRLVMTISRGRVVARDGQFVGEAGWGRFLRRKPMASTRCGLAR